MLEVESMCVDVSRVGRILDDVSVWAGQGVTLVTGRSGCGSTTLLRLVAGYRDRQVVRRRGVVRLSGRRIDQMSRAELRPLLTMVGHRPLGGVIDLEGLGAHDVELRSVIEELGLTRWCGTPAARMPACVAARMALVEGIASEAPVLLLDQVLAPMTSMWRSRAASCIARVARAGRIVVWAEHALEHALGVADSVVEIVDGHVQQTAAPSWSSSQLPPTPLQQIAARSGEQFFTDPAQARDLLAAEAVTAMSCAHPQQSEGPILTRVDPAGLRLSGRLVDVRAGQVLGVVSHDPVQAHRVARRLAATVNPPCPEDRLLRTLLRQTSVRRACELVDRRSDRPIGTSMELADEVQTQIGRAFAQCRPLRLRLLHAVFAEAALACRDQRADIGRRKGLADGDQPGLPVPAGRRFACQQAVYFGQPLRGVAGGLGGGHCGGQLHAAAVSPSRGTGKTDSAAEEKASEPLADDRRQAGRAEGG